MELRKYGKNIYVAFDGKEFKGHNAEKQCIKYEIELKFKNIPKAEINFGCFEGWYYCKTIDDLECIHKYYDEYEEYEYENINFPQWIGVLEYTGYICGEQECFYVFKTKDNLDEQYKLFNEYINQSNSSLIYKK